MKYKVTRKEICQNYYKVYAVGYCGLQPLAQLWEPVAYNCGVYGWNFDVYQFGGIAVCTGYRSMPGKELPEAARRILRNAEKYERENREKRIGTSPEVYAALRKNEERYMLTAARRFIQALREVER